MKILVMGGLGFIGSHLCRRLTQTGASVRIFDKLYASRERVADILDQVQILEGDAGRPDDVLAAIGADTEVVIDLIHTTVPQSSMTDPRHDVESNVAAHVGWLSALAPGALRKIIYLSSGGTVYGVPRRVPIEEDHPTDPVCAYGISKLAIEKYVAMYARMHRFGHCILRPPNVYGPGQQLHINQGVIGVFADQALRNKPLELWGDGTVRRDYLYIDDLVDAFMAALGYSGRETIFNLSGGRSASVLDIVAALETALGREILVRKQPARAYDVPVNWLSSRRFEQATGWRAAVDLQRGVEAVVDWCRAETRGVSRNGR